MYVGDLELFEQNMGNLLLRTNTHEHEHANDMNLACYGEIALMCPECFHLKKYDITATGRIVLSQRGEITKAKNDDMTPWLTFNCLTEQCEKCGEIYPNMIMLDPNISDTIQILNLKGYHTLFSCEGHGNDKITAYIYFKSKRILDLIADTIPITWYIDYSNIREGKFIIRSESANYTEALFDIYEWAKDLVDLNIVYNNLNIVCNKYSRFIKR